MPKQSLLSRYCSSSYENWMSTGPYPDKHRADSLVVNICNFVSGWPDVVGVVSFETFCANARRAGGPIDPEEMFDWIWVNIKNASYYMKPSDRSFNPFNASDKSLETAWSNSYPQFPHTRNGKVYNLNSNQQGIILINDAQVSIPDYGWSVQRAPYYRMTTDKSTVVAGDTVTYTIVSPPPRPHDIVYIEDEGQIGEIPYVDNQTRFTIDLRNQTTITRQVKPYFFTSVETRLVLFTGGFGDLDGDREAGAVIIVNPEPTTTTTTTTTTTGAPGEGEGPATTTTTTTAAQTTTTTTAARPISGTTSTTTTTTSPDTVIWGGNKSHKAVFYNNRSIVRLNIPNVPVYGDLVLTMPNGRVVTVPRFRTTTTTTTTSSARYALDANGRTFTEGDTVIFTLNVINVPVGTKVYYTITGVSDLDIEQASWSSIIISNKLTGYFEVGSKDSVLITLAKDLVTEGAETLTMTLNGLGVSRSVSVVDSLPTTTTTTTTAAPGSGSGTTTTTTVSGSGTTTTTTTAAPGSGSGTTTTTTVSGSGTTTTTTVSGSGTTTTTTASGSGTTTTTTASGSGTTTTTTASGSGTTTTTTASGSGSGTTTTTTASGSGSGTTTTTTASGSGPAPTITIAASTNNLTAGQTSTITFSISGTTSDFTISDILISGPPGSLTNLTPFATPSDSYTTIYTPPATSSGTTTLTVPAGAFSVGGVFNTTPATLNINFDTQLPSMTISASPSSITKGQTSTITFTVTNSSYATNTSSDFSLADVDLNDFGYLSSFSGSGSTFTAIYNPPDGVQRSATISVSSNKFTVAGTNNQASNTLTLNYDTRGASLTKVANLSYGAVVRQKVDLYFPPNTVNPAGVICFIHGGGWGGGSKDSTTETTLAQTIANNDYAVVNINYRLTSDATAGYDGTSDGFFPNNVDDIVDVLRLCTEAGYGATKKHNSIDYFGLIKSIVDSTNTIIVSGSSAGGHLALMGTMKHWVQYSRPVTAVMNIAGPADLWDGGDDNDYDEDRGLLPEIAVIAIDKYVGINPNLAYRGETEKKAASPRWYYTTQALGLFFTSIKWLTISNNYDNLVRTTVMARLHYALNPSNTSLINVHQNSGGNAWAPDAYGHYYTSPIEDVIIYQANRITNRTNKFYTGSSISISIAASRMTIDVTSITTMSVRFSLACHSGSGGAGAVIPVYWRVSNRGDTGTFPTSGHPIPDDRTALKNKGITANDLFVDNGVVNLTHYTDHDVNIQFRNTHLLTGTRFFAVEAYLNSSYSGDPVAISNPVKVIGPTPSPNYSIQFTSASVNEGPSYTYSYTISATGTVDYGATGRWFKVRVSGRNITANDLPDPGPGDTDALSEAVLFDGSTLALPITLSGTYRADAQTEGNETLRIDLITWLNGEAEPTLSVARDYITIIDTSTG